MPLVPNNTSPITPNSVLIPQIVINTRIIPGGLQMTAMVTLQPAAVDDSGNWTIAGPAKQVVIQDINNLPTDLAPAAEAFLAAEMALLVAINDVNNIRKVV